MSPQHYFAQRQVDGWYLSWESRWVRDHNRSIAETRGKWNWLNEVAYRSLFHPWIWRGCSRACWTAASGGTSSRESRPLKPRVAASRGGARWRRPRSARWGRRRPSSTSPRSTRNKTWKMPSSFGQSFFFAIFTLYTLSSFVFAQLRLCAK